MITALLVCISTLLVLRLMLLKIPHPRTLYYLFKLPGPWGLPLIGHTLTLIRLPPQSLEKMLTMLAKKYKRLVGFTASGIPIIGLFQAEDIKHLLVDKRNISKGVEYKCVQLFLGDGLFTNNGELWRKSRKLMNSTQFNVKKLEATMPLMVKESRLLVDTLMNTQGRPVDIIEYFLEVAINIIMKSLFGEEVIEMDDMRLILDTVKSAEESMAKRVGQLWKLNQQIYALTKDYKDDVKVLEAMDGFFQKYVSESMKGIQNQAESDNLHTAGAPDGNRDKGTIEQILKMKATQPDFITDKYLRDEVLTLVGGAHETTGLCAGLMMYLLAIHPDIQEKCYEELVDVVGEEEISVRNIKDLVYLEMVMKETLRLYPPVPYYSRSLDTDLILGDGVVLPKGANVGVIPSAVHRNEEHFPDPERFDPDRFLPDQVAARHPYAYIPFSAGPRNCIGYKYAQLEVKVMTAIVLKTFTVRTITKLEELEFSSAITLKPKSPIMCNFIPRQ